MSSCSSFPLDVPALLPASHPDRPARGQGLGYRAPCAPPARRLTHRIGGLHGARSTEKPSPVTD